MEQIKTNFIQTGQSFVRNRHRFTPGWLLYHIGIDICMSVSLIKVIIWANINAVPFKLCDHANVQRKNIFSCVTESEADGFCMVEHPIPVKVNTSLYIYLKHEKRTFNLVSFRLSQTTITPTHNHVSETTDWHEKWFKRQLSI